MARSKATAVGGALLVSVVACVLLLLTASPGAGQEPARENCPPGFVWQRMSGTGCVQETVPENGKVGYDGHALCVEPYIGLYERRNTTDGKPAPGSPYTSFAYLTRCVTQAEYDRIQERVDPQQPPPAAPGSSTGSSAAPSPERRTATGVLAGGALLALGAGALLVNRPRSERAAEAARRSDRIAQRREELQARLDDRRRRHAELNAIEQRLDTFAGDASVAWDLNEIVSELAALASLVPAYSVPAGLTSVGGTVASMEHGHFSAAELRQQALDTAVDLARLRGVLDAEIATIESGLAALDNLPPPPDRLPAEAFSDIDVLEARIADARLEVNRLRSEHSALDVRRSEWNEERTRVQFQDFDLRDRMLAVDAGESVHQVIAQTGALVSVTAGLLALAPVAAAPAAVAGWISAAGNTASFLEWLRSASPDEAKAVLRLGRRGNAYADGQLVYRMADAERQQGDITRRLEEAGDYLRRLRDRQADLVIQQNRGVLWRR